MCLEVVFYFLENGRTLEVRGEVEHIRTRRAPGPAVRMTHTERPNVKGEAGREERQRVCKDEWVSERETERDETRER